jgi:RNA polymerase sigma-70 factor (ECF subfamily)
MEAKAMEKGKAGRVSDMALVTLSQGGNEEAFLELVERYTEKVSHLAMRITRSEHDTEEVVQEVFITLYTKLNTFQGKSAFSSWLFRITANTAFMKLRSRRKHAASSFEELSEQGVLPETQSGRSDLNDVNYLSVRHELRALIEEAMASLPDEYRTIFVLRDVDGLSNQETGTVLGLTIPAVKSRLHRARLLLRKKLVRYYKEAGITEVIEYDTDLAA